MTVLGNFILYDASIDHALTHASSPHIFFMRRCLHLICAFFSFLAAFFFPLKFIHLYAGPLYISYILSMMLILFFTSSNIYGAHRWCFISGWSFQPSEWLFCFLCLYLAHYGEQHPLSSTPIFSKKRVPFLMLLGFTLISLLLLPDFGSALLLLFLVFSLLFMEGYPIRSFFVNTVLITVIACLFLIMAPYRLQRITRFFFEEKGGFQLGQSLATIAAGGWWGGSGKPPYLPMRHTDFIFSSIVFQIGKGGAMGIILLYGLMTFLGISLAKKNNSPSSRIVILCSTLILFFKAFVHLAVCLGLCPTKGIILPFISHGGSSFIACWFLVGLILNASLHPKGERRGLC